MFDKRCKSLIIEDWPKKREIFFFNFGAKKITFFERIIINIDGMHYIFKEMIKN